MAYSSGSVSVGTSPTAIASVGIGGGLLVSNATGSTVYLGGSNVAASGANQGYALAASAVLQVPVSGTEDGTLYGIVASSTQTVSYLLAGSTE